MKRVALCTFGLVLLLTPALLAQEPSAGANRLEFDPFRQEVSPPGRPSTDVNGRSGYATRQQLVFRKAALRAAQRQQRIAMNKSFGYSPLRPPSSAVPAMGSPMRRPVIVGGQPLFIGNLSFPAFAY